MANTDGGTSWEKIQLGVKDTERLIGKKEYNSAMIKARQTLEFMVKLQAQRAGVAGGEDLMELIDILHQNHWISKTTCEHYHKIRMIGNKAVHEGDENAYNANQAYHMLSQEVYTFANNYRNAQRGRKNRSAGSSSARSRRKARQRALSLASLLRLLIPILCVVLLIIVIRLVKPAGTTPKDTSAPVSTESMTATTTAPEASTEETKSVYKTTTELNVRPEPNQEKDRIALLPAGTTVDYVRAHDAEWAVILYEGKEAYVASKFLKSE